MSLNNYYNRNFIASNKRNIKLNTSAPLPKETDASHKDKHYLSSLRRSFGLWRGILVKNLKIDSLKISHLFIILFTITILLVTPPCNCPSDYSLGGINTSNLSGFYFLGIDIKDINISNMILPLHLISNKNGDKNKVLRKLSNLKYDFLSPIFIELISILSSNPINKETQLKIEQFLQNQGLLVVSEQSKLKQLRADTSNSLMGVRKSNELISKLIESKPSLIKLINNYKTNLILLDAKLSSLNTKIINSLDNEFLVNIMYGRILTILSNNQLLNNKTYQVEVTINLGKEMVNRYNLDYYKKVKQSNTNMTYINWKLLNQELIKQTGESQFQFDLGNILINFMIDLKLIKNEVKVLAKDEKRSIFVAGSVLVKLIPKLKTSFTIQALPNRIPMIVPGKLYKFNPNKELELGGYLLNGEEYTDEIILANWELSSESKLLERNDISDMVNKINSVAFKINGNVLDYILLNNDKYGFFTKANSIHPLSLKQKLTLREQREIESFNSRKHLEINILGLATIFRDISSIYLPVRLDYRGRLYCVTEYLNYQGIELAKGLLQFSNGEKVNLNDDFAIKYLKVFGANCYGLGKKSLFDRIAWVDDNLENIINFDNGVLLNKAENKILFLSFCFEYIKYIQALNNKESFFVSNLPIQLDASCNGFQHLTLLIDDLALSKELNFNDSTWNENPKDFYTFIALKVKNYFSKKLDEYKAGNLVLSNEEIESFKNLARLDIYRALIKKAVMTIPYNASTSSIIEYIKENFDKQKNPKLGENSSEAGEIKKDYYIYKLKSEVAPLRQEVILTELDFKNLRKALKFVIFVDYPKLTDLAEYLKGIAKISNTLNLPIP